MDILLTHCAAALTGNGSTLAVFFLGGLMGSLTHCLPMCGPAVACQAACAKNCGNVAGRALQLPYHTGRIFTYTSMGFLAGMLSAQLQAYPFWPWLAACMLVAAGLCFLASALAPVRRAATAHQSRSGMLRGMLMSFMPCGLLYAALMAAASLGNPATASLAMCFFALGTLPVLFAASGAAAALAKKWQGAAQSIGRIGLTFNGLSLLVMAASVMR